MPEASRGQPFERWKALAEAEAGGGVLGVVAGDAAIDEQTAQRHHEWLQPHLGDEQPVHRAERAAAEHDDDDGRHPVEVVIDDQVDEDGPEQGDHRADRQLDPAGDDDEGLADGEQAEQADLVGGIGQVARQQEPRIDQRHRGADHDDEDKKAEILLVHPLPSSLGRGRRQVSRRSAR